MSRLTFILIFCANALPLVVHAQDPSPPPATAEAVGTTMPHSKEERNALATQAQTLKSEASAVKAEAARQHEIANAECWHKFLVSHCLEEARQTLRQEESHARQLEREAKLMERNIRMFDATEDAAKRDAENARREAQALEKGKTTSPVELSP